MHRRDFLSLSPRARPDTDEIPLLRLSRRAMATDFEVLLPLGVPEPHLVGEAAFELLDALEAQMTVYRDTSEISRLNRLAAHAPVPLEPRLFALLEEAARLSADTDGAFDVTAGALIKAWGFYKGPRRVPTPEALADALARTGMSHVERDSPTRRVRYRRPGLEVNLGSIGKGYALDRVGELLRDTWKVPCGLVHGGRSSVLALGVPPNDPRGWPVGLAHPWEPRRLGVVHLRGEALGTSAATFRHLEHEGRKLGHVLDPRTGWPAEGVLSATAVAPTAAEADALATAFFINGVEWARRYCATRPAVGAILLANEPGAELVVVNREADRVRPA